MPTITRVLIANRGEIAVRIARTCREMGLGTVAVHSDPDATALHVRACDEAVRLAGATPRETYLDQDAILAAAHRTGADAVHPGYGFLSENAGFAQAVQDAGLVWIGPPPQAIAAMGDKIEAKRRMADAGVPLLPGADVTGDADLAAAAEQVGFPLMVKAAAGGGGKGMRIVRAVADLEDEVAAARREARGAFGDDRVFLERYVERPRHIEIQVIADAHGRTLHLFERECSVQRRHQKVVEESPSPVLPDVLRREMGAAAVAAAEAIGYTNAGTVEFIAEDRDGEVVGFSFLEMNTRLQVEHPVTELVTGLDLVRLQLLVAMGEPLPFTQAEVQQRGHAIEVRLYAEDPANDHLPATGTLHAFAPYPVEGVRYDVGIEAGSEVSPHYDPMLAKVIAHGGTRPEAAARLRRALERTALHGVTTNRDLLVAILGDEAFLAGDTTTAYLDERFPTEQDRSFPPPDDRLRRAALVVTVLDQAERRAVAPVLHTVTSGFTNDPHARWRSTFQAPDGALVVEYRAQRDGTVRCWVDGDEHTVEVVDRATVVVDGRRIPVAWSRTGDEHHVVLPDGHVTLREVPRFPERGAEEVPGATLAPMPGAVVSVAVEEGQRVAKGDLLVALEAMKMEHRITAPFDGTVAEVHVSEGQQVQADTVLVVVDDGSEAQPSG